MQSVDNSVAFPLVLRGVCDWGNTGGTSHHSGGRSFSNTKTPSSFLPFFGRLLCALEITGFPFDNRLAQSRSLGPLPRGKRVRGQLIFFLNVFLRLEGVGN